MGQTVEIVYIILVGQYYVRSAKEVSDIGCVPRYITFIVFFIYLYFAETVMPAFEKELQSKPYNLIKVCLQILLATQPDGPPYRFAMILLHQGRPVGLLHFIFCD